MAIIVYGIPYSTRTQRVLFVLEKLGLPYQLEKIDLALGEQSSPEFIASHHPFGKVPAIEHDGVRLFESRAIARYLVAKKPGALTLPTDAVALGTFEEAASVDYSYFEPAVSKLAWEKIFKKRFTGQEPDPQVIAQLERDLKQVLDYYEKILAERKWLSGEDLSLIDVFTIPWFHFLNTGLGYGNEIESRQHLKSWWNKASQDPAWKKVLSL
ncbi:Glutathione transferase [Ascochyta rabiei]|uniref:glutathione transferase n=1 Tax=Didymella rabiei TaxID=5454 RepID=A0A163M2B9_DIDRA|nr:Glutathione transferase [Ascochyta rabiei]KZM28337.1 hypothetical protein ST47_g511 [Ascochyta rabiei]UPX20208.1 Glutathione transferase [Ascochyta rabiei]